MDFKEYENGIADVIEFLVGSGGKVSRNVHLLGKNSKIPRQIDVLVEGHQFGINTSKLIIDCKSYAKNLDVNDISTFEGMVADVGAEAGWLVTTKGYSEAAENIAASYRGVKVHLMPVEELLGWRPKGTGLVLYALESEASVEKAAKAVRAIGFRARIPLATEVEHLKSDEYFLEVFRYYKPSPEGSIGNSDILEVAGKAISDAGVDHFRVVSTGVVVGGGTPGHRLLRLTIKGQPTDIRINVANEAEVRQQIDFFMQQGLFAVGGVLAGLKADDLDVERPDDWPVSGLFPQQLGIKVQS
ncbi:restriction endonuclease [Arthrobacter sp. HMWF013]|uniref:restriction endonuclease n=1 Tax=Arthrobacter sp. HMWF013 TaxID=2056849 RepID=UPI0015E82336|nr:restriction endonuclease [Arthrobacter sp. HMWF013]